ncbi:MFS transporter [Paraburkholderia caballeronis]|uniref:MFS transporter n=1 Tax=Paraburkholderia caballeronis TaxID=416943 RepID=UPI00106697EC|nr:MFS transporter [Paraburkholderia caballeronis]TDV19663.1 putative MFS family arabinose efflux permease [Paraburkholderia caballeronis]TDV22262.1 putative MFS family arabinose efflux permease [Paraburkholderia caballeronis]TDV29166.1 putative MFS family arabinose efflux permease [Paraburkholderia caballeronis]
MEVSDTLSGAAERPVSLQGHALRRVVVSCALGNALEWYDFFLYGTAAALVFGQVFFPKGTEPLVAALGVFAGFAVGFLARPFGGILFSHIGDRYGRRVALIWTLALMGGATFLMGLLPSYGQIGVLAPALLVALRVVQGLAAGGEWGGSVLMITESAPAGKVGYFSAYGQAGLSLGFLLSAAAVWLVRQLPDAAFLEWGWRLPFLASVVIFGLGTYIRRTVPETQAFRELAAQGRQSKAPVLQVLREHPRAVLKAMGLRVAENGSSYVFVAFSLTYAKFAGVPAGLVLGAMIVSFVVQLPVIVWMGRLSDRIGTRPVYLFGAMTMVAFAYPFFHLIGTGNPALMMLAFFLTNTISYAAMVATQPTLFSSFFGTSTRYSGLALGHEIAAIFSGGLSPLIATSLLAVWHSYWPIVIYLAVLGLITTLTALTIEPQKSA